MRLIRVARLLAERIGIDLEITRAGRKELAHKLAPGDVGRHGEQFFDVFVEILAPSVGNRISDVGHRTGHEGQGARTTTVAGFVVELGEQGNLEVIEIVIVSRQLPASTVLHLGFDDVPILVIVETVSWDGRRHGCQEWLVTLR